MSANKKKSRTSHRELFVVSKDAPFQFVEAYKSLRTNLEFLQHLYDCLAVDVIARRIVRTADPDNLCLFIAGCQLMVLFNSTMRSLRAVSLINQLSNG